MTTSSPSPHPSNFPETHPGFMPVDLTNPPPFAQVIPLVNPELTAPPNDPNRTVHYIYALKLKDDKYYIGKTTRPENHKGSNSDWTNIYTPLELIEINVGDTFDEDKQVLKYMQHYGIDNVRGGSYSNLTLSFEQHLQILRGINNAIGACLACGRKGHALSECNTVICYRCGRVGHAVHECTALTHGTGGKLDGCVRCGRCDHWAIRCNRSKDFVGRPLVQSSCIVS